jgi:hypothetical protein
VEIPQRKADFEQLKQQAQAKGEGFIEILTVGAIAILAFFKKLN